MNKKILIIILFFKYRHTATYKDKVLIVLIKHFYLFSNPFWIFRDNYLPRQWGLGLNLGSLSLFFPRSVTNRRLVSKTHALPVHAHRWSLQELSSWKVSTDSMISRAMKSHTNEQTVRGRLTLKDVKRFRNGSICKPYERSSCERTF